MGNVQILLRQHVGAPCAPCVEVGADVKKGTLIATPTGLGANIFSSVYGKVAEITEDRIIIEPADEQPDEFVPIDVPEDASKLDGCNVFQTFYKIALPSALPAIATLGIFSFVTTWNSFMWPLIVTNTENMRTLAVGLTIFKSSFREITMWGELMACACICSIPVIVIFILGKKYLINNPMAGAGKEG